MPSEILNRKPELSFKDQELINRASQIFAEVRDVPYVLGLDGDFKKLLKENKGNCARKHLYLAHQLESLGYKISLGITQFDWRDLPIPQGVISLLKNPIDTHTFLFAEFKGYKMRVDATWDTKMPVGFVPNKWDGLSQTQIAVMPLTLQRGNYKTLEARLSLGILIKDLRMPKTPTPFNDAFNFWLGRT